MEKEKARDNIKDYLELYRTKKHPYNDSDNLYLAINFFLPDTHKLGKAVFKSYLSKFRTDIKNNSLEDAKNAFLKFIDAIPESVFTKNAKDEVGKPDKIPEKRVFHYGIGMGGERGLSKEWITYMRAEAILFVPSAVIKKYNLNIDVKEFYSLLEQFNKGKRDLREDMYKSINSCYYALLKVLDNFLKLFDPHNQKHRKALSLIFGENSILYFSNPPIKKGKQVTKESISKAIRNVRAHMADKYTGTRDEKLYTIKKIYYITWLSEKIFRLFDFHKEQNKYVLKEMKTKINSMLIED
jgi:hypothetical protein